MSAPGSRPSYPDDVAGALPLMTVPPSTRYYDTFASEYPSDIQNPAIIANTQCSGECVQELDEHLRRSRLVYREITNGNSSPEKSGMAGSTNDPNTPEHSVFPASGASDFSDSDDNLDVSSKALKMTGSVSRCGVWDPLGPTHAWRAGSIELPSRKPAGKDETSTAFVISTVWDRLSVSSDSKGTIAAPLPKPTECFAKNSTVFHSTKTTLSCSKPGNESENKLVSTMTESHLHDTFVTPPYPKADCPDVAVKLFDLALSLDARSAFAVMTSSDFVCVTDALFHARSCFYAGSHLVGECTSDVPDTLFSFSTPSLYRPAQAMALPPKLSGVARDDTGFFNKSVAHVGARGLMSLPTPFSFTIGYDVGMYGHCVGSVFANFDCSFLHDYSIGTQSSAVNEILKERFPMVSSTFIGGTDLERCVQTTAPIAWANYEALKYKTRLEDSIENISKPCAVVWKDLSLLGLYRLVDGGFSHIWFDSDMSAEATATAGLGIGIHDMFDLAADVSCGEVANVVPSLTGGDLSLPSLAALYSRIGAVFRWNAANLTHDTAAVSIMLLFWWQLGNMRHRFTEAVRVPVASERLRSPAIETINHRPSFEDFAVGDRHGKEIAWLPSRDHIPIPDFESDKLTPELRALARDFVIPYSLSAIASEPNPPAEHICASRIMAVLCHGLNMETRPIMWEWASYLWDNGTLWSSFLGTLCYHRHDGKLNDDRARATHTKAVWIGAE